MRIFKKYSISMIVKHIRTFFKGRFYIEGRGAYEFANGLVVLPQNSDELHKETVYELNKAIKESRTMYT
ncbi:MAG: DUF1107 domain-containing protein [Ruminobacter sp.]|nr:DUF1107 domain-containing protein [Ruminobacter sp.]